jgi:hypothetical protein
MKPDTKQLRNGLRSWLHHNPHLADSDLYNKLHDACDWIDNVPEPNFDRPPISGKRATSKAAARRVEPHVNTQRRALLDVFRNTAFHVEEYGFTDSELVIKANMPPNTLRPRRNELVEDGWITDTGHRRKNQNGNQEIVWGLCPS